MEVVMNSSVQKNCFLRITSVAAIFLSFALAGCGTVSHINTTPSGKDVHQSRDELEVSSDAVLSRLYATVPGSKELVAKSTATLVFPNVIAAGLGVGGEFGEGVLREGDKVLDYYNLASLSVGLQAGAQSKAIIFLFMTSDALEKLRKSKGWSVGADASVAVLKVGANGAVDLTTVNAPVQAFVLTNAGLMANLTLEGTKITRLEHHNPGT
jgi:lipid-binding SYLF domain-containing protein